MLLDPFNITYDTVPTAVARVSVGESSARYSSSDGEFVVRISHQKNKNRTRHMIRLDRTVVAADPLTAVNSSQMLGVYIVIDEPDFGFSDDDVILLIEALKTSLLGGSKTLQVLGGES